MPLVPENILTQALTEALAISRKTVESSKLLARLASSGSSNASDILESQCKELGQGVFQLIVLGEFKNGKSTLLNSFLGDKVLPAKQAPATAVITRIYHGDPSKDVTIHYSNGKQESLSIERFRDEFKLDIQDHDHEVSDRFKDILFADVPTDLELCRDGVILVDSPGLAENPARTKVTQGFFKKSTAAVLLLDATQPISQEEERWALDLLANFGLDGVFFVVNKINLVDEEEVDETKEYIRRRIEKICSHHQVGEKGERIYFIDARLALRSRCEGSDQGFQHSGVKDLLTDLSVFLSSSGRERAAITRLSRSAQDLLAEQERLVTDWKAAASSSIEELKIRKAECQERLERLKSRAEEMKALFGDAGLVIADATYENLEEFLRARHRCWDEESKEGLPLSGISVWDGFTAPFERLWGMLSSNAGASGNKAKIEKEVEKGVEAYIQRILVDWAEELPNDSRIQHAISKVRGKVNQEIKEISVDLESIKAVFAGISARNEEADVNRMTQAFLGVLMLDPSQVTGSVLGSGDWGEFLVRFVLQIVIYGVLSAIWWPAGIIAWILQEVFHIAWQTDGFEDRIRKEIGKQMFPKIMQDLASKRGELKTRISEQFSESGKSVYLRVVSEVQDVQDQQAEIVRSIEEDSNRVWAQIKQAYELLEQIRVAEKSLHTLCE
jgi:GTPase SAR1 family protein